MSDYEYAANVLAFLKTIIGSGDDYLISEANKGLIGTEFRLQASSRGVSVLNGSTVIADCKGIASALHTAYIEVGKYW